MRQLRAIHASVSDETTRYLLSNALLRVRNVRPRALTSHQRYRQPTS